MLGKFVTTTIVMEFWKGSRAISSKTHQNLIAAMVVIVAVAIMDVTIVVVTNLPSMFLSCEPALFFRPRT